MVSKQRSRYKSKGFTLIESIIIVAFVGILAMIAVPSFGNMLDSIRLDQATTEIRIAFSNAQRQAIRNGDICNSALSINQYSTETNQETIPSTIYNDCLPNDEKSFSDKVIIATNILPLKVISTPISTQPTSLTQETAKWCEDHKKHKHKEWPGICLQAPPPVEEEQKLAQVAFGNNGGLNYEVKSDSENPADLSGKIVLYTRDRQQDTQKCVVLSKRLGLARIGSYRGGLTQSDITRGLCTAREWNTQT